MKMYLTLGSIFFTMALSTVAQAQNGPINCYIQTYNGRYLTAVGGGGRITDVIHSDATRVGSWEKFKFKFKFKCGV